MDSKYWENIGKANVCPVTSARNFGTWMDSSLSLQQDINKTCLAAYRRIRKHLLTAATETLVELVELTIIVISYMHACGSHR